MANKKTAISIEQPLFEEIDSLAKEMEVSRSHLFTLAAREYIQQHKSRKLLETINAAYNNPPGQTEEVLRSQMKTKHRLLVKDQW
jgi:metal-responsive CopG/Arc/MetJ family transcriptional regulator